MPTRFFHTAGRSLAIPALFALVAVLSFSGAFAQAPAKKVVKTEADLPRFNYPLTTTATELLKSDDATFNAFAAKVRADVDSVLNDYDVQDHAALRDLVGVKLQLELLAGDDEEEEEIDEESEIDEETDGEDEDEEPAERANRPEPKL